MIVLTQIILLITLLGVGAVFGTDVFCALVQRPALARVDEAALTAVMGNVHRFGDKRMPIPGVVGLVGSASVVVLAAITGHLAAAAAAGAALVLLAAWLVIYTRISAPINRVLKSAADHGETLTNVRALQAGWDRVIVPRATLQGMALIALSLTLILL